MKRLLVIAAIIAATMFCSESAFAQTAAVYVVKVQTKVLARTGMPFPSNAPDMLEVFANNIDPTAKGIVISIRYEINGSNHAESRLVDVQPNAPSVAIFNVDDVTVVKVKSVTVDELKSIRSQETDF